MRKPMQQLLPKTSQSRWWLSSVFFFGVGLGVLTVGAAYASAQEPTLAEKSQVPWECSEYSGEAQARCMTVLLELQQKHISKLEAQLNAQEKAVNDLKEKIDRQEALARSEGRVYKQDPRYPPPPYVPFNSPPYVSPYPYAPLPPIGIYLQPPWRVPRYYGFGPGYWGQPGLSFNFRFGGNHRHRHR
ncbi:MAG TPA: hypothetical protein PKK23_02710 [Nitrospirales bacterium]|nr:hypothetical protein [Nitrospiraceae bacterium]HNP27928.1 hypothetical protein [Nitrospirales bacterium]